MMTSYIRTALRNLQRNKTYSFINIFGLSIGICCCLLLTLYVFHETSYDKHHIEVENLYRVNTVFKTGDNEHRMRTCSPPIVMTLMEEVAGIEYATRVLNPPQANECLIRYNDNYFYETDGLIADSTIFKVITYEFAEGDINTALNEPNSVVISNEMATRLFGANSALYKVISITQGGTPNDFRVTGVFNKQELSHIQANFFTSMNSSGWAEYLRSPEMTSEWVGSNFVPSYVRLRSGENVEAVTARINETLMKYAGQKLTSTGRSKSMELEPVKDIYLKSDVDQSPKIYYVYGVLSIGIFILIIACINFMNLSTARATRRSAEIGMRKVMGAYRFTLIRQIMAESMAFVIISAIVGLALAWMLLPAFNQLTGISVSFTDINTTYIVVALISVVVVTGLLAGGYPAFYISSFQPAQVLKGQSTAGNVRGWLRQTLVVFQFVVAIMLICATIVVSRQVSFVTTQSLGFDSNAKIVLPLRNDQAKNSFDVLRQEIAMQKTVRGISGTVFIPGQRVLYDGGMYAPGMSMESAVQHGFNPIDTGYMNLMKIEIIAGRALTSGDAMLDRKNTKLIINETSALKFNFTPENAVGQVLTSEYNGIKTSYEVVGVMEDIHQTNLHEAISPLAFFIPDKNTFDYMIVDIDTRNLNETIAASEQVWNRMVPGTPFEFTFLDDNLQSQYTADRNTAMLVNTFSSIAICISCLGLYALSAFMAEQRMKEIGVRKVLGASVPQVMVMMSKEYVRLIALALLIAVPLSWIALSSWLETFAYRITMGASVFAYAGVVAIFFALATVAFETRKAATANPARTLSGR
jgi:putative ABC transport system permease protein